MKSHAGKKNPNYKDGRFHAKRLTLRLSNELHGRLVQLAADRGMSLNDVIILSIQYEVERQTAVKDGE